MRFLWAFEGGDRKLRKSNFNIKIAEGESFVLDLLFHRQPTKPFTQVTHCLLAICVCT